MAAFSSLTVHFGGAVQVDGQGCAWTACGGTHRGIVFGPPRTSSGDARRVDLGERGLDALLAQRLTQDVERAVWGDAYVDHDVASLEKTATRSLPNT